MPSQKPAEPATGATAPNDDAPDAAAPVNVQFTGRDLACARAGRMVFAGIDFGLAAGALLLLTGPNGVGKSSLLRVMAGLLPGAAGTLMFQAPEGAALLPTAAYLGHADALKPQMTVAEELDFAIRLNGPAAPAARASAIAEAADLFDLDALGGVPCRYLSAGQRRRVALARVFASRAWLWLLDEPTIALDEAATRAFTRALAAHRAAGGMAVVATHQALAAPDADVLEMARFAADPASDPFYRELTLDEEV